MISKEEQTPDTKLFSVFTTKVSAALSRLGVFIGVIIVLIAWAISGPVLRFSDTWQLLINTGTTIVTFLMVFILQNTQDHGNPAVNFKLEALTVELKVSNTKLYGAEDNGKKYLRAQTDRDLADQGGIRQWL